MERHGDHGMYQGYWDHGGMHPLTWVLLVVLIALLLALLAFVLSRLFPGRFQAPRRPAVAGPLGDAIGIARLRYAKGELTRDEFIRMNEDLGAPPDPAAGDPS